MFAQQNKIMPPKLQSMNELKYILLGGEIPNWLPGIEKTTDIGYILKWVYTRIVPTEYREKNKELK